MTRRVVFVVFPDLQILDLTGPMAVFSMANRLAPPGPMPYRLTVASVTGEPLLGSCGLAVVPDTSLSRCRGPIDTLITVGGVGTGEAVGDGRAVRWIRSAAPRARRVTSVCTGAFLLAEAGLLEGRRATTHWASCATLAARYPAVDVADDPIFVRDGDVWTSAGVTAGMDLALALLEDDMGAEMARLVARWLVVFVQRPGGQSQFSTQLAAQHPERSALREVQDWIVDHVADDLSVTTLAVRSGMSARNFARAFRHQVGMTPGSYVESVRVEAAKRLLETTGRGLRDIAATCGFGTVETMHRTFKRSVQVSPGDYRRHFRSRASA